MTYEKVESSSAVKQSMIFLPTILNLIYMTLKLLEWEYVTKHNDV